ncbi:RNA polymerase sigma factor [Dyadobacter pollutisoli]|uniref:Sigma-70 family RNA polymerase sigma factor n=1 Tax=Dyadobacter pollutisoli TaxID=2910158 RepID=A0A9E8N745_9BACT|nr:sigma-70 family RNA polymerase sigma factor [Dyadobacter pollutisoli]WAC09251.1 sigma-70 family RNA polymerase sigma factor [Dyadobacter pollutisoli]
MDQNEHHRSADRIIVEKVLSGNTRAFGMIMKQTEGLVAQIVFKMISNREERRDIAQDIYLKVFQKLDSFRFQAKLSTWIARIAYNTCINHLEKHQSRTFKDLENMQADDETGNAQEHVDQNDMEEKLISAEFNTMLQVELDKLPEIYKLLITLYHYEELSYSEIGQIVNLPEGTVKNYLFRARKMLRERLEIIYNKGL